MFWQFYFKKGTMESNSRHIKFARKSKESKANPRKPPESTRLVQLTPSPYRVLRTNSGCVGVRIIRTLIVANATCPSSRVVNTTVNTVSITTRLYLCCFTIRLFRKSFTSFKRGFKKRGIPCTVSNVESQRDLRAFLL